MSGGDKMSYPKWGYLRETKAKAEKDGVDEVTGLEEYLKVIFPEKEWFHNKELGIHINGSRLKTRPDYRNEEMRMIIEFDGIQHYSNFNTILSDDKNTKTYEGLGYAVIRIPYFIQLTNEAVWKLFKVNVREPLFDGNYQSLTERRVFPACLCTAGIERMAKEFAKFPDQYEVNLNALKKLNNDALTGVSLLESAYKKYAK